MSPTDSGFEVVTAKQDERRRFERISVPFEARVAVLDTKGHYIATIRQLARGGVMLEPEVDFKVGKTYKIVITDESEDIRREVEVIVRYADARQAGCEFRDLSPDAAVEIGILMGKYYSGR